MKKLALIPALLAEWASVAFDFCAAICMALADYFYSINETKAALHEINRDRSE